MRLINFLNRFIYLLPSQIKSANKTEWDNAINACNAMIFKCAVLCVIWNGNQLKKKKVFLSTCVHSIKCQAISWNIRLIFTPLQIVQGLNQSSLTLKTDWWWLDAHNCPTWDPCDHLSRAIQKIVRPYVCQCVFMSSMCVSYSKWPVHHLHVSFHVITACKLCLADGTGHFHFLHVMHCSQMSTEWSSVLEAFVTLLTPVRKMSLVDVHVTLEAVFTGVWFIALRTCKGWILLMRRRRMGVWRGHRPGGRQSYCFLSVSQINSLQNT